MSSQGELGSPSPSPLAILAAWRRSFLVSHGSRPKSLVLWGESLRGVALWAKYASPSTRVFEFLRYDFNDEIGDFDSNRCEYAVFDDCHSGFSKGIGGVPYFRQFFKPEQDFVVHPRYKPERRITWGKPAVLLTHDDPFEGARADDVAFLKAYCEVVQIPG
jgi:hypothetical protein